MSIPVFRPNEYRLYVMQSGENHILVEGKYDKRFFEKLLQKLCGENHGVQIDTAEQLIECATHANREKVEEIAHSVTGKSYASRFVGFADREFRDFSFSQQITDSLQCHRVSDRLVWSRGHSTENYFLDYEIFEDIAERFTTNENLRKALQLFESIYDDALDFAAAVSLLAHFSLAAGNVPSLNAVKSTLNFDIIELHPEVTVNLSRWKARLIRDLQLSESTADSLCTELSVWKTRLKQTASSNSKWLCHGHIGFNLLWQIYSRCLLEVCSTSGEAKPQSSAQRVCSITEELRFVNSLMKWLQTFEPTNTSDYPADVIHLLGLPCPVA